MEELESECREVETDNELVEDIEEKLMLLIKELYLDVPEEAAMALQRLSISIQEMINVRIPNKDVELMRSWAREDIERTVRQMTESQEIMYQ